jgi:lipopolysaccharide biosynthesis regulator YciM
VDSKRTIEQLLELLRVDPNDTRARLKLGDIYVKKGEWPNALEMYEWVAKYYAQQGLILKAVAVYKYMCSLVVGHAPQLRRRYAHVPLVLADLFQQLGVPSMAATALDALGPGSGEHELS